MTPSNSLEKNAYDEELLMTIKDKWATAGDRSQAWANYVGTKAAAFAGRWRDWIGYVVITAFVIHLLGFVGITIMFALVHQWFFFGLFGFNTWLLIFVAWLLRRPKRQN